METLLWPVVAIGAALAGCAALLLLAPAKTMIIVDTPASTARAEMRLLWGLGPLLTVRALPKSGAGNPLTFFNDVARIGQALMTPGIADAVHAAVARLFQLKPRLARIELRVNLGDSAQNRVVQTATQAALATAPAVIRESVTVSNCEAPGAELAARIDVDVSPWRLHSIYSRLKNSRPAREFRRRLKRRPKPTKKAPREVRAS